MSGRVVRIDILGDSKSAQSAFAATDAAAGRTQGVLGKLGGGIGAVGKAFGGMAKLAGGFILAQGLIKAPGALINMAKAAADDEANVRKLQVAIENAGGSWDGHTGAINDAIAAGQRLGFSDDSIRDGLGLLIEQTGSQDEALRRMSIAQDLARGTGMDLGMASKLVGKINAETTEVLKKYGITLGDNATQEEALQAIEAKFGGQAAAWADTSAGKMAILKDRFSELQETIGAKVLPILTAVTTFALDKLIPAAEDLAGMLDGPLHAGANAVKDAFLGVVGALTPVANVFLNIGKTVSAFLHGDWAGMEKSFFALPALIRPIAALFIDLIADVKNLANALRAGDIGGAFDAVVAMFLDSWDTLRGFGTQLFDILKGAFQAVDWGALASKAWTLLGAALGTAGALALDLGGKFLDLITGIDWGAVASKAWELLGTALGTVGAAALGLGGKFLDLVTGVDWGAVATSIWSLLGTALSTAWDGVVDAGAWLLSIFTGVAWADLAGSIWVFLSDQLMTAWDGIVDATTWFAGILGAVDWVGIAASIWGFLSTQLATAWDGVVDATTWFTGIIGGVDWPGLASTIWTNLSGALSTASGAAEGGGSLLAGLLDTTGIDFTPLTDQLTKLMEAIQPIVDIVGTNLTAAWQSLKGAFDEVTASITGATPLWTQLQALWVSLQPVIDALVPALKVLGEVIGVALAAAVVLVSEAIRVWAKIFSTELVVGVNVAIGILTSLIAIVTTVVNLIVDNVRIINDLLHGDWSAAWTDAKQMVQDMVDGVIGIWSGLPALIAGYAADLVGQVLGWFQNLWSEAVGKVSGMVGEIETSVGGLVTSVGGFFSDLYTTATGKVQDLWNDVVTFFGNIYTSATTKAGEMKDEVVRIVGTLPGEALSAIGDLSSTLYDAGKDLVQGLIDGVSDMLQALRDKIGEIGDIIGDIDVPFFSPPNEAGYEIGQGFAGQLAQGIIDALPAIAAAVGQVGQILGGVAQGPPDRVGAPPVRVGEPGGPPDRVGEPTTPGPGQPGGPPTGGTDVGTGGTWGGPGVVQDPAQLAHQQAINDAKAFYDALHNQSGGGGDALGIGGTFKNTLAKLGGMTSSAYAAAGGLPFVGANGQPFDDNNPLPVRIVGGSGGTTITQTINAPQTSPAAIRAAGQMLGLELARQLNAEGL